MIFWLITLSTLNKRYNKVKWRFVERSCLFLDMTPEHAHNLSSYYSFFTQSRCDLSSSELILFFTTISVTSLGVLWWVVCLCCLFFLSFHWLDHVAAVWFHFVPWMYEPGDCIRVSRVKYLCSTTSSTQGILIHLRQNFVRRSMYAVPWKYHLSQVLHRLLQ